MSLDDDLRAIVRDEVRLVVREEIQTGLKAHVNNVPVKMPDEFLSTQEAARIAAVTSQTIRAWMQQGKLQTYHAGREKRVSHAELLRLLKSGSKNAEIVDPNQKAQEIISALTRKQMDGGRT